MVNRGGGAIVDEDRVEWDRTAMPLRSATHFAKKRSAKPLEPSWRKGSVFLYINFILPYNLIDVSSLAVVSSFVVTKHLKRGKHGTQFDGGYLETALIKLHSMFISETRSYSSSDLFLKPRSQSNKQNNLKQSLFICQGVQ